MSDVGAIGKQLVFEFAKHSLRRAGLLRQRLGKELVQRPRLHLGEYPLFFDVIEVVGQQIHNPVAQRLETLARP